MNDDVKSIKYKKAGIIIMIIIFGVMVGLLAFSIKQRSFISSDNLGVKKTHKTIKKDINCSVLSRISHWQSQGACYVEDGLFLIPYCSTLGDICILRCYDSKTNEFIWEKMIEGCGHANAICFCPKNRKIYICNWNLKKENDPDKNAISVIDYDNIDLGVEYKIKSPARGGIYSLAYDREQDVFYSTNYAGIIEGEANVLFSYNGVFESVKEELILDDFTVRYNPHHSSQGVQCVKEGIAYIPYYSPTQFIAGYDINTGELVKAYSIPDFIGDYELIEIQGIVYDYLKNSYIIIDAFGMIECSSLQNDANIAVDKNNIIEADCEFWTRIPDRCALCGCYVEEGLYIVAYVASDGNKIILRCYDSNNMTTRWTKTIEGDYANTICYREKDRRLYLAGSYTYANENDVNNAIYVLDYDDIDAGIIDTITPPGVGGVYSIAYDTKKDIFYSTNSFGTDDGEANILYEWYGVFEKVKKEIVLDDLSVRNDPSYETMGVQCIVDNTAYYLYHLPTNVIAGYDLNDGRLSFANTIPNVTSDGVVLGRPESIIYNSDNQKIIVQTAYNLIEDETTR